MSAPKKMTPETARRATEHRGPEPRSGHEGHPTLDHVTHQKLRVVAELVTLKAPKSEPAERFRRLKTILRRRATADRRIFVITSALPNEGKTLVALNLAISAAMDHQGKVLLIDADLRRPSIGDYMRPKPTCGLIDVLSGRYEIDQCLSRVLSGYLHILPAGERPGDPVALLQSSGMGRLLDRCRQSYSLVVLDTPPVMGLADADALGEHADGALVVTRAGLCSPTRLERAIDELTNVELVGVVLNDRQFSLADSGRSTSYYYKKYYNK